MKRLLLCLMLLPCIAHAQSEDDFLPEVQFLVLDSTEHAAQRFCKEVMSVTEGYKFAFVDREDILISKYMYDNTQFQTVKFDFQFSIEEAMAPDSTMKKSRLIKYLSITAELPVMTKIYGYLFNQGYTPDKLMAISANDKIINYKGTTYSARLLADDFKAGYWILSFYRI